MDAIETETVERYGTIFRVVVYPDADAPNPLEDGCEMGTILSLNHRHRNFDPEAVDTAIRSDSDAVPLSYYEHGNCLWSVAGDQSATARCPWDSVPFAGVWLPDAETLASARKYGGSTRHHFMRKRARQACDAYTQWCNGEIYGYEVYRLASCEGCGGGSSRLVDACWGFYGLESCLDEARAVIAARGSPGL